MECKECNGTGEQWIMTTYGSGKPCPKHFKCSVCGGLGEIEEPIIPIKTTKRLKVKIGKSFTHGYMPSEETLEVIKFGGFPIEDNK